MGTFVVLKGLRLHRRRGQPRRVPGARHRVHRRRRRCTSAGAIAAVATALAIGWSSRRSRLRFDTSVGVLFAGTFALGVMLFSTIEGYVTDLLGYLLGNVLGIGNRPNLIQAARRRTAWPSSSPTAGQSALPSCPLPPGGGRVGAAGCGSGRRGPRRLPRSASRRAATTMVAATAARRPPRQGAGHPLGLLIAPGGLCPCWQLGAIHQALTYLRRARARSSRRKPCSS